MVKECGDLHLVLVCLLPDAYMIISFLIGLLDTWFFASSSCMGSVVSTIFWNIVLFLCFVNKYIYICLRKYKHHQYRQSAEIQSVEKICELT